MQSSGRKSPRELALTVRLSMTDQQEGLDLSETIRNSLAGRFAADDVGMMSAIEV
jgi:hypothetical protein